MKIKIKPIWPFENLVNLENKIGSGQNWSMVYTERYYKVYRQANKEVIVEKNSSL